MQVGIIYIAQNTVNGKLYIGQTTKPLGTRKQGHLADSKRYDTNFYRAIKKYGWDSFEWKILYDNVPINKLNAVETWSIANYDSYHKGYNSTPGGKANPVCSAETRKKISRSKTGKKRPDLVDSPILLRINKEEAALIHKKQADSMRARSSINWDIIDEVRTKYTDTYISINALAIEYANKYDISASSIKLIIKNKTWKDPDYIFVRRKIDQSGKNNPCWGRKLTDQQRKKISGVNHGRAILTELDVIQIRTKYSSGHYFYKQLAKEYKVSERNIGRIVRNETWKNVSPVSEDRAKEKIKMSEEEKKVYTGRVIWFKGYGYIERDDGEKDMFVHWKNINMEGYKNLVPDQIVSFTIGENDKGPMAVDVTVIKDVEPSEEE